MSIESQLIELNEIKSDILTSISNKGVTVPENAGLKDVSGLVDDIEAAGSYADLNNYETCLYTEFDSTAQLSSSFGWYDSAECNALDFTKEITFSLYIPEGYYSGGNSANVYMFNTDYRNSNIGSACMFFEMSGGSLTFSLLLPSSKDLGGMPKARIYRQPIDYSFVEGKVSTLKIIGDTLIFNGVSYTIPNYSSVYLDDRPSYMYSPAQISFMQGFRFYGLDCGTGLKIRAAKRLSDDAVCLINLMTGHDSTASNGGFILGPTLPLP